MEFFSILQAEAANRRNVVVNIVKVVKEVIVSCDRPDIPTKLELVPEDRDFGTFLVNLGVVDLRLSRFAVLVLFCLPQGTNTTVDHVFDPTVRGWYFRDFIKFGSIFG